MMTSYDFYRVISIIVPLYISIFIGYGSVKWRKLLNQEQCSGISRFCSLFAVPVLSFYYITKTNLYEMDLKLLGADILQKMIVLVVLACWYKLGRGGSIELLITIFSICTLPNVLILGLPIIKSMYHDTPLIVEIFLAQSIIWHPLLLIMYEYYVATIVISQNFDDTHARHKDIETTTDKQGIVGGISSPDTKAVVVEATSVADVGGGEGEDLNIHIHPEGHESSRDQPSAKNEREIEKVRSTSMTEVMFDPECQRVSNKHGSFPSNGVMTKQIAMMCGKKLIDNPNTYATILGLVWSFISFKFLIATPQIMTSIVTFLSNASLGMGMFNMGLSIGLQPGPFPCGKVVGALTMVLRFIIGPMVMAFASLVIGLRGTTFHISVVQAALSQGVVPSIFAVQYNVYPEVFSAGMTIGMVLVLPVMLLYYTLFEMQR